MKINRSLIQALRKERSWSQDQLAAAAGLNLRTVQRIERSGDASLQSRRALAAALNVEGNELDAVEENPMPTQFEYRVTRFDVKWPMLGNKVEIDTDAIEKEMNALGAQGWDLAKMVEILAQGSVGEYTTAFLATFKRAR